MEDDAVSTFVTITGAEAEVAAHYLEACEWDLDRAVDQFMENENERHHHSTQEQRETLFDRLLPQPGPPFLGHPVDDNEGQSGAVGRGLGGVHQTDEEFFDVEEDEVEPSDDVDSSEEVEPSGEAQNSNGRFTASGSGVDLPDGVTMSEYNETRMIESTLYDRPFQGSLDDLLPPFPVSPPRPPSPSTLAARELRQQQDAEFEESQRLDRQKREADEAEKRKQREEEILAQYRANQEIEAIENMILNKEMKLPREPNDSDLDSILIVIRFPDGRQCRRRFLRSDQISNLFDFVDVHVNRVHGASDKTPNGELSHWWKIGGYNLVTQFPRRVFQEESGLTLKDAGFNSKQEALFVELK
eukprot:g3260.t1